MADTAGTDALRHFEDFVGIVGALHKELARIKAAEAERLGFKGGDVMCLYYLVKHPEGLTAVELARLTDVSRAAMSRTVAGLSEAGLVEVAEEQNGGSRYRAPIRLTERGREATAPMASIVADVYEQAAGALTGPNRTIMYDSLNQILDALRTYGREPSPSEP